MSFSEFIECYEVKLIAYGVLISLGFVAVSYFFDYFFERNLNKRVSLLERIIYDKLNLEGYFKFNPDGTLSKVSDLDIDCETVDINKPTK